MQSVQETSSLQNEIKVSVVVPSFNHERYIGQCLDSIINQTLKPYQLIVIDDGSKDNSVAIIEKALSNCPFPSHLYVRKNKGLCKTLNEGLEKSNGDFFAYLGSDDIWLPKFLEHRTNNLVNNPLGVLAFGHCYIINKNNEIINDTSTFANYNFPTTKEMLLYDFAPSSPTVVYRKKFLEKQKWNSNIKLEDYDLYLRLSAEGNFIFEPTILSAWRIHDYNTSNNNDFMLDEAISAIERNINTLNLSNHELEKIKKRKRVFMIDNYLAEKKRLKALKLFINNIEGFTNKSSLIKQIIKIITPVWFQNLYRNVLIQKSKDNERKLLINEKFQIIER